MSEAIVYVCVIVKGELCMHGRKCVLLCVLALLWFPLTDFVKDFVAPEWDRKSEQVQHINASGLLFRIPLVTGGNRFIAAAVTVWPLTNLMWQRGGGWGERAKAEGRERRHTQKSRDERWREEKATSFHKDGHKQLALSDVTLYLAGKIKFSCCGSHFIQEKMMSVEIRDVILTTEPPQPGRRSESKTDFQVCTSAGANVDRLCLEDKNIAFSPSSQSKVAPYFWHHSIFFSHISRSTMNAREWEAYRS